MKKYRTLQKNVDELESQIRSIFSSEDAEEEQYRQRYMAVADEIERKLVFLKSHIAAEFSSPDPDHHLSHLSRRLGNLHSAFVGLKNNLLHGQPLDSPHFDAPSSCSCSDESCCLQEGQGDGDGDGEVDGGPGSFKVYDNPLSFGEEGNNGVKWVLIQGVKEEEDGACNAVKGELIHDGAEEEEEDEDRVREEEISVEERREKVPCKHCWCYWRPMVIGVVTGGVTVAAMVVSVMIRYGVECRFGDYTNTSVFPRPT